MNTIDLRSDTVTRPSPAMLHAMMSAAVGDDVFGEDPTVNALQSRIASMFAKEAALFVPSGTMGNELCIKAHTQPGDEIIVEEDSHIIVYETGGPSFLAGVQMHALRGTRGVLDAGEVKRAVRPDVYYLPRTALICIENTHGRSAGSVYPLDKMKALREVTREAGVKLHLDGARLWNASVASGNPVSDYARLVDSLSVCFSKGLGAPIGSIVIGDGEFIEKVRKYRKIFGGGMRQVGILAAAALYALDHNIERLSEDHRKAKYFAGELSGISGFRIDKNEVQTNMVIADIGGTGKTQSEVLDLMRSKGVLLTSERLTSIRAVMHLDVSMEDVEEAARQIKQLFR